MGEIKYLSEKLKLTDDDFAREDLMNQIQDKKHEYEDLVDEIEDVDDALPWYKPQLTPDDPTDDCNQEINYRNNNGDWVNSSGSKIYFKKTREFMDQLSKLGKLKIMTIK